MAEAVVTTTLQRRNILRQRVAAGTENFCFHIGGLGLRRVVAHGGLNGEGRRCRVRARGRYEDSPVGDVHGICNVQPNVNAQDRKTKGILISQRFYNTNFTCIGYKVRSL